MISERRLNCINSPSRCKGQNEQLNSKAVPHVEYRRRLQTRKIVQPISFYLTCSPPAAFTFIDRERFHGSYSKFANKLEATKHLCETHCIEPNQICFVFDDVLDLSLAEVAGFRIFIPRKANPLFNEYVIKHQLADYVTGASSGESAVREACELLMGLNGNYNEVITERKNFSETYSSYLTLRKATTPVYYTMQDGAVVEVKN